MYFPEKELKPYAEPLLASDLKEEEVYFSLTFVDDDMCIPFMQPLVFIGRDLQDDDTGVLYFQDIDSYRQNVRFNSASEDDYATFIEESEAELNNIFDFEHALDGLMRCFLRRKTSK